MIMIFIRKEHEETDYKLFPTACERAGHDMTKHPGKKYIFLSQALKLKLPTLQPVHAGMLKESNYFDSFYYVNSMCPVRWPIYEACMRLNSCLMRRINCFPFVLRGMETHRKQYRRCQECMREGLKGTAWLSLVVLLLIFNAYLRGFCRIHRATKSTLVRIC